MNDFFKNAKDFSLNLKKIDTPSGRFYICGKKMYPSITTILSLNNKTAIEKWKNNIGEAEAKRIQDRATNTGTEVHTLMYEAIMNRNYDEFMKKYPKIFKAVFPWIEKMEPFKMETPLYSDYLGVAGTPDFIGTYNDIPYIVDFKTETKEKDIIYIENYFLQLNAYSVMVYECYGLEIKSLKILMMNVSRLQQGHVHEFDFKTSSKQIVKIHKLAQEFMEQFVHKVEQ